MKKLLTLIISLLLFSGYTIAQGDAMVLHYNTNLSQEPLSSLNGN